MSLQRAQERLAEVRKKRLSDDELATEAVALAENLHRAARRRMTWRERRQAKQLSRMIGQRNGKLIAVMLSDRVFRSNAHRRAAHQFRGVLSVYGLPKFFGFFGQIGTWLGKIGSMVVPGVVMPIVTSRMRAESRSVILSSEPEPLERYVEKRRKSGNRLNFNSLGEAVLGEEEAARRLDLNKGRLQSAEVGCLSVKLSSIFSQIDLVDYEGSLETVKERIRVLYRTAKQHHFERPDGQSARKLVYLDMEEYRDLSLTIDAFRQVLDEAEFRDVEAGIVLQAYLPDSYQVQKHLTKWASDRVKKGGRPIRVRIVKGANLAMEQIEASMRGWPQAPYSRKEDTDANFKRMVAYALRKESAEAVHVGIGSHNLFDIAYAMLLREMNGVQEQVEFEMLEGMANHQANTVRESVEGLLLYVPLVSDRNFRNALAYLVRRLDENTADENFLRDMFSMRVRSEAWKTHEERFLASCESRDTVKSWPNRKQNRSAETPVAEFGPFRNEADTDWTLLANRLWIDRVFKKWKSHEQDPVFPVVGGSECRSAELVDAEDPSVPGVVAYRYGVAGEADVDRALDLAAAAQPEWDATPVEERSKILKAAAVEMARARGDIIGCLILDAGKSVPEADVEISEAIDFANYYARGFDESERMSDCVPSGRGVVVVAPPWNFPYSIPAGGALAALMAGNSVILKPAPQTVLSGWMVAKHLWDAGVPKNVLQFVPCKEDANGQMLVSDARVDTVVLTGAHETAMKFQGWRDELRVLAETSGKNSLVVTAAADQDLAVHDIVASAFGHSGQKCSACSLAILEREVYDSLAFRRQLRDAAKSLKVGSAWDPGSKITPLIDPPGEDLRRALTELDDDEEWLLEPRMIDGNPRLWSPGIKLGVQRGGWFHRTECFGPVLGLVRAKNLREAIEIQNDNDFALTAGIQSLDRRETGLWKRMVQAGNAYVNRTITGAVVQRQPFGGWKKSSWGPGAKAGGPNYLFNFARFEPRSFTYDRTAPTTETNNLLTRVKRMVRNDDAREDLQVTAWSYSWAWNDYFGTIHDPAELPGESNILRYHARSRMLYRFNGDTDLLGVFRAALAGRTGGVPVEISLAGKIAEAVTPYLENEKGIRLVSEDEAALVARLDKAGKDALPEFLRVPGGGSRALHAVANKQGIPVSDDNVVPNGRLEMRYWFREQCVSETLHRYGNIVYPRRRKVKEPPKP